VRDFVNPNFQPVKESTLFLGMSADGSSLFLHHVANLGSTRWLPDPVLMALLVGLPKSTNVPGLTPRGCLASILNGRDDDVAKKLFCGSLLEALVFEHSWRLQKIDTPEQAYTVPGGPLRTNNAILLVPRMAKNAHSSFAGLRLACAEYIIAFEILCEENKKIYWWGTAEI
jgi:hypothetical protein